jgi:hypothetical protein
VVTPMHNARSGFAHLSGAKYTGFGCVDSLTLQFPRPPFPRALDVHTMACTNVTVYARPGDAQAVKVVAGLLWATAAKEHGSTSLKPVIKPLSSAPATALPFLSDPDSSAASSVLVQFEDGALVSEPSAVLAALAAAAGGGPAADTWLGKGLRGRSPSSGLVV